MHRSHILYQMIYTSISRYLFITRSKNQPFLKKKITEKSLNFILISWKQFFYIDVMYSHTNDVYITLLVRGYTEILKSAIFAKKNLKTAKKKPKVVYFRPKTVFLNKSHICSCQWRIYHFYTMDFYWDPKFSHFCKIAKIAKLGPKNCSPRFFSETFLIVLSGLRSKNLF